MQIKINYEAGFDKSEIQVAAAIAMTVDHMAIFSPEPWLYFLMKFVGRAAIVIMCYFIAEGFHKTRNIGKYIARMAIFAAISQIPFYIYIRGGSYPDNFVSLCADMFRHRNVIFNLFVGLCLLTILKSDYKLPVKLLAILAALRLAKYSDWTYYAILWIVGFGLFYGSIKKQMIWLVAITVLRLAVTAINPIIGIINTGTLPYVTLYAWLTTFGCLLPLTLLPTYSGERGCLPKWTWYIFYPSHFIVLELVRLWDIIGV